MDQISEFESPLILRGSDLETSEAEVSSIRNNWSTGYERIYQDLSFCSAPTSEELAAALAKIFSCIVKENEPRQPPKSPFNAKKIPAIALNDYFVRIAKFSRCSFETLILAVIYIDRLHAVSADQFINSLNAHK